MPTYSTPDESFDRLHAAGWSVGDVGVLAAGVVIWSVIGANGESTLRAKGIAQAEAGDNDVPF